MITQWSWARIVEWFKNWRIAHGNRMVAWTAWYSDGKVYNSRLVRPHKLPNIGLQAVMVQRADGTKVFLRGAKWYCWKRYTVIASADVIEFLHKMLPNAKEGTSMPDAEFKALMQETK